jgi:pilus assembly protein Flp/PilA
MKTRPLEHNQDGASAVEYSFIVAAIAAIIVITVFAVGRYTSTAYEDTCDSLASGDFSGGHTCP